MEIPKIAVIGGGISGLALAHRLLELRAGKERPFEVLLFEKENRAGGTIESFERDGFTLEMGPDSFISEKPWALELSERIGLGGEVIGTKSENRKSFVVQKRKLIPLPEGFYLVAPVKAGTFLKSPLFSLPGKMRMMMEPLVPRRRSDPDESVSCFIRRRFGREALERAGQPMLAGIYTGDPEALSIEATMPRFRELEKKYGSVIRGLRRTADPRETLKKAGGPRYSLFLSYKKGMETLTKKLAGALPPGVARFGAPLREITREAVSGKWKLVMSTGELTDVDAVCLTTTARAAVSFLRGVSATLSEKLGFISYESVATVNLAYRRGQIAHALDGFGFVAPRTENCALAACSFTDRKFDHRAPEGCALLRAFVGGAFGKGFLDRDDSELLAIVEKELSELLGIRGRPLFSVLRRYPDSMVQYRLGHMELVNQIENEAAQYPGLFLTGSSYRGVGIPDCIHDAEETAEKIYQNLSF